MASIFNLPYEEYIKAREDILVAEAITEKLLGRPGNKCKKLHNYEHKLTSGWWLGVWQIQYESQGGRV